MRMIVMAMVLLMAGCGGGGDGGGSGVDPRLARIDIYEAQRMRVLGDPGAGVMGMPVTEMANVPTTGTVDFAGSMTVRAETAPATSVLAGDAVITMDFEGTEVVAGRFDSFFGVDPGGVLRDYDGNLTVTDGTIGPENGWSIDYAGVLNATGQTLVLDGTVTGEFLGNPVGGIAGAEFDGRVIYNSTVTDAVVTIIGEEALVSP